MGKTPETYHVQRWPEGDFKQAEIADHGPYNEEEGRACAQKMSEGVKGDTFISLGDHLKVGPGRRLTMKSTASGVDALAIEQA